MVIAKTILAVAVLMNLMDQVVATPINVNQIPLCYNTTSSTLINSLNCTCTSGACMSTNSICPCQQTAIASCACVYLSTTPCTN